MPAPSRQPNVLFITTDQHRFDAVGFMGSTEAQTPHLDRLAAAGVVFERCYVTNPVCMPSRASMLTGQFPDANGVRRNGIEVPDAPWGLARTFLAAGYHTGMFGKTHFAPLRKDYGPETRFHDWHQGETYYGFQERSITHDLKDYVSGEETHYRDHHGPQANFIRDDYLDWMMQEHPETWRLAVREGLPEGETAAASELWTSAIPPELHQSHWIADRTIDFVTRAEDAPWFAWCSFVDPHHPFNAPASYRDRYDPATFTAPVWADDELDRRSRFHRDRSADQRATWLEHWREYRAQYYAMISLIDDEIGRLLGHLEASGQAANTVVVFTSDHGELLGDHGLSRKGLFHYEPLIHVPLVVAGPGVTGKGTRQSGLVQTVDAIATMLDLAGVPVPTEMQGLSLTPWLGGDRFDTIRPHVLVTNGGEGPHYDPWPELRTLVRDDGWKLQHYVGDDWLELDNVTADPHELAPADPQTRHAEVRSLLSALVDAGSAASVIGQQTGRW